MERPLDELYFIWLYGQVGDPEARNPNRTYWTILKLLFTKEFVWFVPNDDNRCQDGRELRAEFAKDCSVVIEDENWLQLGCSIFELLVGLSRRLAFEAEGEPRDWFWHLMDNLGLGHLNDRSKIKTDSVDEILDHVIWRTYDASGRGGLFPLRNAAEDQRTVELWYQLNAYILEMP